VVVSAGLGNVNLSALRPFAIRVVGRQEPDGRPQPIAGWELGFDFDAAVFDGSASLGIDTAGLDWVDDRVVGCVGAGDAIGPQGRGAGTGLGQIDDAVVFDEVPVLESRLYVEHATLNEYIFIADGGFFELTIAEAAHFSSFCPDFVIETAGEVVRVNGAVCVRDDGAKAIPNEKAGKTDSDEQSD
jgi:hypothetical protein